MAGKDCHGNDWRRTGHRWARAGMLTLLVCSGGSAIATTDAATRPPDEDGLTAIAPNPPLPTPAVTPLPPDSQTALQHQSGGDRPFLLPTQADTPRDPAASEVAPRTSQSPPPPQQSDPAGSFSPDP
ncbi:MAG TPA: hypothetical protein V6D02_02740, partial [Candidatus Obscuribacterales bacterium]